MQLCRTKVWRSFILSTKKWIKCFPWKILSIRGENLQIWRYHLLVSTVCVCIMLQWTAGWKVFDYYWALAGWHSNTRRRTLSTAQQDCQRESQRIDGARRASSRRDRTSFLLPRVAWSRSSFLQMALLGCWSACCLRGGSRRQRWSSSVAAADCLSLQSLLGPRGRGRDAKGDSFRECIAMPCTCLVKNKSSQAWIGAERVGWQESSPQSQNVQYNSIFSIVI